MSGTSQMNDAWTEGPTIELTCTLAKRVTRDDIISHLISAHLVSFEQGRFWLARLGSRKVGLVVNSMEESGILWLGVPPGFVRSCVAPPDVVDQCGFPCVGRVMVGFALLEVGLNLLRHCKVDGCVVADETESHPDLGSYLGGVAISEAAVTKDNWGHFDFQNASPKTWVTVRPSPGPWDCPG